MKPVEQHVHGVEITEPELLERHHEGRALGLLGRLAEPFEPFTTLLA